MRKIYILFLLAFCFISFSTSAQIVANDDNNLLISGFTGGNITSVLNNDTLNSAPVSLAQIIITVVTPANPIWPGSAVPSINPATGIVTVNPGTPAGTYTITYQICEVGNTTNCDTAIITISVSASPIVANNDFGNPITSLGGVAFTNVLINDTFNGVPVVPSQVTITMVSSTNPGVTLSGYNVVVAPGTPEGNYTLTYQICENLNPTNCDTAIVSAPVSVPFIDAVDDEIIASAPNNNFYSVLLNDTLNGVAITPNNVTVTTLSNTGVSVDAQGFINFGSLFPPPLPGVYLITYQICEIGNPNNCDTAQVIVHLNTCTLNPTITSIVQPDCVNVTGSVQISNLPVSNWTINLSLNGVNLPAINGSGSTTVLNNLTQGNYSFTVAEGICISQLQSFTLNSVEGITVSMQGAYNDFNNDGVTNVGDLINYQIIVTNTSCNLPITDITIENSNLNMSGGILASLAPLASDNSTFTAYYVLNQEDINVGNVTNSIQVQGTLNGNTVLDDYTNTITLSLSDGIKLNAFLDSNNNGIQDGPEQNINVGDFSYQINNESIHTVTSSDGTLYLYESDPSNNYNVGFTLNSAFSSIYSVTPSSYTNLTVESGSGVSTYNFAVTALPFNDISTFIIPFGQPIPGFTYSQIIYVSNNGNQPIASGTLTFTHDPALTISSISVSGTTPISNGFTYDFGTILPNQYIWVYVYMTVPTIPSVSLGQIVSNSASVTAPANDFYPANNSYEINQIIVGSYDPNDKQESHGGRIQFDDFTTDDYLTYTIRFENTGTAEAINIRVEDILDSQLDENTIRMVAASHNYVLDRVGSNLSWRFDGINLPPSVPDTQIGHGFITFQIKPKAGFAIGDIIPNTAEIYFDFNPAIVTNTCTTEFVETLGNENFAFANLNYFPNPVKNSLTISNSSLIDSIEITSILGQKMLSQKVNSLQTDIDMSALSSGIYFVKVTSEGQEKTVKIVKE
ncbi:MAG: T9SS type A sorting domain-containing protein [Flavobacterium sp.]|nr:T9SS type A sorting domain-containing protein [Flavobacterium sp.]